MQIATESAPRPNRASRRKVTQPLDAANHPAAHLRLDVVLSLTGMSRSQWYRLVAANEAPKPLKFGPRCSRWLAQEIQTFLAVRTAQGALQ
jgi:prophage regulatory protein